VDCSVDVALQELPSRKCTRSVFCSRKFTKLAEQNAFNFTRLLQWNLTWDLAQFKQQRTKSHNQCWLRRPNKWHDWPKHAENKG